MIEETLEEYLAHLDYMANEHGRDWQEPLTDAEPIIAADIFDHFETQTGPFETWAAHAESTIERWGYHNLLVLDAGLIAAATGEGDGHITIIDSNHIEFGVDADIVLYAWAQQEGRPEVNLPARPYMWLSEEAIDEITNKVVDYAMQDFYK